MEACRQSVKRNCDRMGLTDISKSLSYDQYKLEWSGETAEDAASCKDKFYQGLFDMLDANENGIISLDEWETHHKCLGIDPTHAKASFDAMDLNKTGTVTRDEFCCLPLRVFFSLPRIS